MILIGQYDSPFVRRVAIALTLYGIAFAHRPWSVFGDADLIRAYNPLMRVPTLVLDDGTVLVDSPTILDFLDGRVGADRALFPTIEPARRHALRVAALATGLADKAVSLFYENRLHESVAPIWVTRCEEQIRGVLAALEGERQAIVSPFWFGPDLGHADIAVAVTLRFLAEAHPGLVAMSDYPAIAGHAARCEALPVFRAVQQPFVAPA